MTYNAKIIKPEIEPLQITDKGLKRYWPNDLTRIRMVIMTPKIADSYSFTFTEY
jgi:hypothetical protein